ncbi:hypothetical protein ACFQ21_01405 [Ohtaekwangia kribbensis]|uniref:Uncharacterized protein n=1 Tax=Ohtaekwangia kribbensis TaxID=688913 RepID=A0ABW3JY50_9BACT
MTHRRQYSIVLNDLPQPEAVGLLYTDDETRGNSRRIKKFFAGLYLPDG